MKILFINEDPSIERGIPIYSLPLAKALSNMGSKISYLYSGSYLYKIAIKPKFKRYKKDGINFYELRNMALPFNFNHPIYDISQPRNEKVIVDLVEEIKPDVIHIHSMIGLPSSIIVRLKKKGYPIVTTFHEYWFLCQRRVLVNNKNEVCYGPNPDRCSTCITKISVLNHLVKGTLGNRFAKGISNILSHFRVKYADSSLVSKGVTTHERNEEDLHKVYEYGMRLNYHIKLLNTYVNLNIAVSKFVRNKFIEHGVKDSKIVVNHIGTNAPLTISEKRVSNSDDRFTFGYIGGLSSVKGVHVAVKAFRSLRSNSARFIIYGSGSKWYLDELKKIANGLPIEFRGKYDYKQLTDILAEFDCVVIPAVCYDTSPQTVFEAFSARKPVIASDIGGIPDFVRDGENGLLFNPGETGDLESKFRKILGNKQLYEKLKKGVERPKSTIENAIELGQLYKRLNTK